MRAHAWGGRLLLQVGVFKGSGEVCIRIRDHVSPLQAMWGIIVG